MMWSVLRDRLIVALLAVVMVAPALANAPAGNVDLPRYPSISPDGSEITFSWRGDLWKVSSEGGAAVRLTAHVGDDLRSAWSPDGKQIAFNSNRSGYLNVHLMDTDGRNVTQITHSDRPLTLMGWGADENGEAILSLVSSRENDVYRGLRPYMVSPQGGEIRRLHDAYGTHPVVSEDGSRVLFVRGGSSWSRRHYRGPDDRDVWVYQRSNGTFHQLTQWEGNDGLARWIGNDEIIYASDREDHCVNLYRMDTRKGEAAITRLTRETESDVVHFDVSANGRFVVYTVWDAMYVLDLNRANAKPRPVEIYASEDEADNFDLLAIGRKVSEAALSPDGEVMAYIAYGEVYVRNVKDDMPTRRVTTTHARERGIVWSPDGLRLFFSSDSDGTDSIYAARVELTRGELKDEFEKTTNPPKEEEEKDDPAPEDDAEDEADEGDEEAAAEAPTTQPDEDAEAHEDDTKKDEKKEEDLPPELDPKRWHDAMRFTIEPVVVTDENDRGPVPSPDGTSLAFRRSRGDIMILDFETHETRRLITGWDTGIDYRWSPDSQHIAYAQDDLNFNSDIWIVPVDGSAPAVNITRHPDNEFSPRWSADGKILAFLSERVNEEYDVWMVHLDKGLEALTKLEREEYYEEAGKAAKKIKPLAVKNPAEDEKDEKENDDDADGKEDEKDEKNADEEPEPLDLDDAWLRVRRVTSYVGNEFELAITPAGDRYIFTRSGESDGLYSIKWDGSDLKSLGKKLSVQHLNLAGDKVIVVGGGQGGTVKTAGGSVEQVSISDSIRIDLRAQASQKFLEAARILGERFYHPTMKNLDWPALTAKYHALATQTRRADEFNDVARRFIGELNGSHLGIWSPGDDVTDNNQPNGRLGIDTRRTDDGFEVLSIVPESPAEKGPMRLHVGDLITAVEFDLFTEADTLDARLRGRAGKETALTIRRAADDGETQEFIVLLTPTSYGAERQLKYTAWRNRNAALVNEWSNGELGYIHIQGMNQPSLDIFERDLYAAAHGKAGLIIDVRNNGGGWTTDRLLASIMTQSHAYTIPRGADGVDTTGYPQDRLFIQRYTLPINMLCNEKSFSNAEIISHAFKTFKRGTLVGQQTYGGVISTGGTGLIDGTFVRLPFRGWYLPDGSDMENNGAIPDILVDQTPEAESMNDDEQLRTAVDDLLTRVE